MPEADAAAREIVRRHFNDDPIADAGAYFELAHLACGVGEHLVVVIQLDPEMAVGKDFRDGPVELQHFFFGHRRSS
jgi:hypothetical protein